MEGPLENSPGKFKPNLSGPQETLLGILHSRAIDASSTRPILGDKYAGPIIERLDYPFAKLGVGTFRAAFPALRARYLDRWVGNFLHQASQQHEPVTVLHLAAGLDTRALRLQEEPRADEVEVHWVDADLPDVTEVRRKLDIPEPRAKWMRYESKAVDVTEEKWLANLGVPRDRKTFVVFEGLTMYLWPDQGRALIETLTSYFVAEGNQMAFDCINWLPVMLAHRMEPIVRNTGSAFHWAIEDPKELEGWHPGFQLKEAVSAADNPGNADLPTLTRWALWVVSWLPFTRGTWQYARFEW